MSPPGQVLLCPHFTGDRLEPGGHSLRTENARVLTQAGLRPAPEPVTTACCSPAAVILWMQRGGKGGENHV